MDRPNRSNYLIIALGWPLVVIFALLALIPLEAQRSNGRSLHDWLDHPDPQHTCHISHYNQSLFGAMLKDCHCKSNCYGALVPCGMTRPVLEVDPLNTNPNLNYGLGSYCCDRGNCASANKLYTCTIVVNNITNLSWTWTLTLPDNTTWAQWQQSYYCFSDDLACQARANQKYFIGQQRKCWIQHWKQGQVTLSYPGPLAGTIGIFAFLIALSGFIFGSVLWVIIMLSCSCLCKCVGRCCILLGQECIDCTNAISRHDQQMISSSNSDEINLSDFESNPPANPPQTVPSKKR